MHLLDETSWLRARTWLLSGSFHRFLRTFYFVLFGFPCWFFYVIDICTNLFCASPNWRLVWRLSASVGDVVDAGLAPPVVALRRFFRSLYDLIPSSFISSSFKSNIINCQGIYIICHISFTGRHIINQNSSKNTFFLKKAGRRQGFGHCHVPFKYLGF